MRTMDPEDSVFGLQTPPSAQNRRLNDEVARAMALGSQSLSYYFKSTALDLNSLILLYLRSLTSHITPLGSSAITTPLDKYLINWRVGRQLNLILGIKYSQTGEPLNVLTYVTGKPPISNRSNRFSVIAQLFLGRIGSESWKILRMSSDFGKILYMCDISLVKVGKGPWELLLELSQENIWLDRGGLGRKYMYRRGLEGLVVARIISFTW